MHLKNLPSSSLNLIKVILAAWGLEQLKQFLWPVALSIDHLLSESQLDESMVRKPFLPALTGASPMQ